MPHPAGHSAAASSCRPIVFFPMHSALPAASVQPAKRLTGPSYTRGRRRPACTPRPAGPPAAPAGRPAGSAASAPGGSAPPAPAPSPAAGAAPLGRCRWRCCCCGWEWHLHEWGWQEQRGGHEANSTVGLSIAAAAGSTAAASWASLPGCAAPWSIDCCCSRPGNPDAGAAAPPGCCWCRCSAACMGGGKRAATCCPADCSAPVRLCRAVGLSIRPAPQP